MKRTITSIFAIMLALVMVLSLAACGEESEYNNAPNGKYWYGSTISWEFNGNELTQTMYNLDDTVHSVTTEIFSMDGNKIIWYNEEGKPLTMGIYDIENDTVDMFGKGTIFLKKNK